jgi:hypothetical protein
VLNAITDTPTDGVTGDVCPSGHYCPEGSSQPTPCPAGTYLNATAATALTACAPCPLGEYCPGEGGAVPQGACDEGYYCPGGQSLASPAEFACPVGHFCPQGSGEPRRCENGTYQDVTTMPDCKTCPAGYFCDNTLGIVVLDNDTTVCPHGHFCPPGTRFATEFPCPIGTFNNRTYLTDASECSPCSGGYYCPTPGMDQPIELCAAGYFCRQFAEIAAPDQGSDANICPPGHYCPQGTADPQPCPKGSFNNGTGLEEEGDCVLCTPGMYCDEVAMLAPQGLCDEG